MDGSPVDGITEIAQEAVQAVAQSENNWAAIILLVALLGVMGLAYVVARASMKDRSARSAAREEQLRTEAVERETHMRREFEQQLATSKITQEYIARMNDRYDTTMNRVTEAFGENSAILRQAKDEIRRNADALNRNTSVLEEIRVQTTVSTAAPRLPKKPAVRKPEEE